MPSLAAFFDSMPGWSQILFAVLGAIGVLLATWKGILPLFFVTVTQGYDIVFYRFGRPIIKNGRPYTGGPGTYSVCPAIRDYRVTNVMNQSLQLQSLKVDMGDPRITYIIDPSIDWKVIDAYLFQTVNADAEVAMARKVTNSLREVFEREGTPNLQPRTVLERVKRDVSLELAEMGVELCGIQILSKSAETKNVRLIEPADVLPAIFDTDS
jgi:regulator of protease activity HflC (stomatin/prohibitin superfamily)